MVRTLTSEEVVRRILDAVDVGRDRATGVREHNLHPDGDRTSVVPHGVVPHPSGLTDNLLRQLSGIVVGCVPGNVPREPRVAPCDDEKGAEVPHADRRVRRVNGEADEAEQEPREDRGRAFLMDVRPL